MEAKLALLPSDFAEEARVAWLSQLPREEARKELMALLNARPDASGSSAQVMAARALVDQFAVSRNFSEAAEWASGLEPGEVRTRTFANIAEIWSRKDSLAASGWVNSLPAGPERDKAAGAMIYNILSADPDAALVWASSLSGREARNEALSTVFRNWFSRSPSQAYQAFQTLSPEERERMIPVTSPIKTQ